MARSTAHLKKHQFKKGAPSANPNGGRAHNPVTKALRNLTIESYREVIELVLTGNLKDLKALAENPDTPVIKVGVATAIMTAITKGDADVIEKFVSRLVGKIPDEINVKGSLNTTVALIDPKKLKQAWDELNTDV